MKWFQKCAAAAAAFTLAFSLCSCDSLSWAAKFDDETTVPIGIYIYSMGEKYRTGVQNLLLSTASSLDEQTMEVSGSDVPAVEYLDKEAQKTVKSYTGAYLMAKELDVLLTEEETESALGNAASVYEADKEVWEQNGVAQSSIEAYYKDMALKSKLFQGKYGADGSAPVTDEELKGYFAANYATIHFIQQYFYKEDGSVMSDQEREALIQEYKNIQSKAESGKLKFTDKCKEFNESATSYKGGYTDSTSRFDTEDEDGAKILALKKGEFTLLVTDSAIALIQKAELDKDGSQFKQNRDSLLIEYKYDDFLKELISRAEADKSVTFNEKAFKKFSSATRDFTEISTSSYY